MDATTADKLLQQASDALLLADADGKIRFSNIAITTLFGYQPEELVGTQHLREASHEAKKASQTKRRFLATASHDLRQPLQALQLLTASLERELPGTDAIAIITRQQHAIDSMTELLNACSISANLNRVRCKSIWRINATCHTHSLTCPGRSCELLAR